jgi:hypothetical protein
MDLLPHRAFHSTSIPRTFSASSSARGAANSPRDSRVDRERSISLPGSAACFSCADHWPRIDWRALLV